MSTNKEINTDKEMSLWVRAFYMLGFMIAFGISESVLYLLAIVSLIYRAVNGENHQTMLGFGRSLARYVQQIADYLSFNTEERPFPFSSWPDSHKPTKDPS